MEGNAVKIALSPFEKDPSLKGKKLLSSGKKKNLALTNLVRRPQDPSLKGKKLLSSGKKILP